MHPKKISLLLQSKILTLNKYLGILKSTVATIYLIPMIDVQGIATSYINIIKITFSTLIPLTKYFMLLGAVIGAIAGTYQCIKHDT